MGAKVFCIDCSEDALLAAVGLLKERRQWEVLYWTGAARQKPRVAELFPQAVFQTSISAARGETPPALRSLAPRPPDHALLQALAPYENEILLMMDRMGPDARFPLRERLEQYHRYLAYWQAVLDRLEPEAVLFSFAPHLVYDYVLYRLCRLRGIPTVMFDLAPPMPWLLFSQPGFDLGIPRLRRRYQAELAKWDGSPVGVSSRGEGCLAGVARSYNQGAPWYVHTHGDKSARSRAAYSWKSLLAYPLKPRLVTELAWRAGRRLLGPPPPNYFKAPGRPLHQGGMPGWAWHADRQRRRWRKWRAMRALKRLSVPPSTDRPYVLVALHFQPERTTAPLGGRFVDQLLMIRLLARWLPPGWRLLVKEAPGYLFAHITKQVTRDKGFYARVASLPNASLVEPEADIFTLVDNARAVATVTGTVGWEALLRGRPALVFGHAWYRGCEGVHWAGDEEACRRALEAIAQGERPDPAKVRLFLRAMEQVSTDAYIMERVRERVGVPFDENRQRLAQAILRELADQARPPAAQPVEDSPLDGVIRAGAGA